MQQQKLFFEEEGYLIIEDLLSSQEIKKCQNEIEKLHLQCKDFLDKKDLADLFYAVNEIF